MSFKAFKPPLITDGPRGLMDSSRPPPRESVERVFDRIGGEELLQEEALKDPKWFFQKVWGKIVQPEKIIIAPTRSVAELLQELDGKMINVTPEVEEPSFDPDGE